MTSMPPQLCDYSDKYKSMHSLHNYKYYYKYFTEIFIICKSLIKLLQIGNNRVRENGASRTGATPPRSNNLRKTVVVIPQPPIITLESHVNHFSRHIMTEAASLAVFPSTFHNNQALKLPEFSLISDNNVGLPLFGRFTKCRSRNERIRDFNRVFRGQLHYIATANTRYSRKCTKLHRIHVK